MTERHFPLERLRQALLAEGVPCVMLPGAQGRSARMFSATGYAQGVWASCVHHTASSGLNPAGDIQYILDGRGEGFVVSNAYTARDGTVTLIASGPTYTEGRGGPYGIIPENKGNYVTFSNEVGGGLGAPFTQSQCRSVLLFHHHANKIAAEIWGWANNPYSWERLFAHFEYAPGRKIDPSGKSLGYNWADSYVMWDMDRFRADVKAHNNPTPPPEDDMGMNVTKIKFDGYAEVLVCFRVSQDTMDTMGVRADPVAVLPAPDAEDKAIIEAGLGQPLTPLP